MTRICRRCEVGDHRRCVGLRCFCEATPRCRRNAELVRDREPRLVVGLLGAVAALTVVVLMGLHGPVPASRVVPAPVVTLASVKVDPLADVDPTGVWRALASCESGQWDRHGRVIPGTANWQDRTARYEGGHHWLPSTWRLAGGWAYARHAYDASPREQIITARLWLARTGTYQWPACSRKVGLRASDGLRDGDA